MAKSEEGSLLAIAVFGSTEDEAREKFRASLKAWAEAIETGQASRT